MTSAGSVVAFTSKERRGSSAAASAAATKTAAKGEKRAETGGSGNDRGNGKRGARKRVAEKVSSLTKVPAPIMGPRLIYIFTVVVLCVIGLVSIYSASSIEAYSSDVYNHDPLYFLKRQVLWVAIGTAMCVVMAKLPYKVFSNLRFAFVLWLITTGLLLAVACGFGNNALGATRSIGIGPIDLQPAEFAKITTLVFVAALLHNGKEGVISEFGASAASLVIVVLTLILIYRQPDLGTSMIMLAGLFCLAALLGIKGRTLGLFALIIFVFFVIVCILQPYHLERFTGTWFADDDPLDTGYQSVQGYMALANGGVFGVGFGMSRQKYEYLPYAYNDFIYAVIGEESGLVGAAFVLLLFLAFVYAGLLISRNAPDSFGAGIAGGLTCMIGWQAILNMACIIGIAPVTGKALPFLSYGGSSLIATMGMVGLVLSVSLRSRIDARNERRRDNLRVMDGGRAQNVQQTPAAGGAFSGAIGGIGGAVSGWASGVGSRLRGGSADSSAQSRAQNTRGMRGGESADALQDRGASRGYRGSNARTADSPAHGAGASRSRQSNNPYSEERLTRGGASAGRGSRSGRTARGSQGSGTARDTRSAGRSSAGGYDDAAFDDDAPAPKGRLSYGDAAQHPSTVRRARRPRR